MRPIFAIAADGADITAAIRDRLVALELRDEEGLASDALTITLDDRDHAIQLPPTGAHLALRLGYDANGLVDMGGWIVNELELASPPARMVIRARAAHLGGARPDAARALRTAKTRAWENISLGGIAAAIAAEHGLEARIDPAFDGGNPPSLGAPIPHLDQVDESDLHLLARLARDAGAVCKIVAGRLILAPRGATVSPTGRCLDVARIHAREVARWRITLSERGKYAACVARWHDVHAATTHEVRAGQGEPALRLPRLYASEREALAAARARLDEANRGRARLSVTLPGRPDAASGAPLKLAGFRDGVDGRFTATRVIHRLDRRGWITTIEGETAK